MNKHFKKPLKISLITLAVGLVLSIGISTWIFNQKISERKMKERVALFGTGLGGLIALVVAPFWIAAAGRIGKERREAKEGKSG